MNAGQSDSKFGADSISMKSSGRLTLSPEGISPIPTNLRVSSLIPIGLIVDDVMRVDNTIFVTARAGTQMAMCPLYGAPSQRVHSRYVVNADRNLTPIASRQPI